MKKYILIFVFFVSCKNNSNTFVIRLTNQHKQFWNIFNQKRGYVTGSYSFDVNGECFYYTNKNGKKSKIFDDDVVVPHSWSHIGDSILVINGSGKRILHLGQDTLVLLNTIINDTILLIRNK